MKKIGCCLLLGFLFVFVSCDSTKRIVAVGSEDSAGDADTTGDAGEIEDTDESASDTAADDGEGGNTGDTTDDTGDTTGNTGDTTGDTGDTTGDNGDTTGDNGDTVQGGCEPNPCRDVMNSTGKCIDEGSGYSCGCRTGYVWNGDALDCELAGCTVDSDCETGNICTSGSKCVKGCSTDEDCGSYAGTYCNKKLARCVNFYASNGVCSEANCQQGCCYAEKGLTGVKCSSTQNPAACGHCDQGEIYSPEESKCVSAACSTTTDNCPALNSGSFNPPARCFRCAAGDFICKASTSTSGCSSGRVINAKVCIPSGGECSAAADCCSGMPCVDGFCY